MASTKSNRSRAPSRPCPGGCGFTIAAKDLHVVCPACLGPEHAQAALQAPISCNQCSKLSPGVLRRRAVFVQDVCNDPVQGTDTATFPQEMESPMPTTSWADQLIPSDELGEPVAFEMEIESFPKILSEDDSVSIAASGGMSDDGEEEDDEDPFAPLTESPGYQPGVEVQQTAAGGTTLHDVCRRAASSLGIDWPSALPAAKCSRLDGKFLVPTTSTVYQALPPFQDCMDDLMKYWERPLSSRVPIYGFSSLDMAGMQEMGWSHMPSMEASLAGHLDPRSAVGLSTIAPKLPQKSDRFSASIFENIYKSSTQTGRATNAITLLFLLSTIFFFFTHNNIVSKI